MISSDVELQATLRRIERFRKQVAELRRAETNPTTYRLSASSYLAEIDGMNLDVRDYLSLHPSEVTQDGGVPMNTQSSDRTEFWVTAQVSIAKSAVMLASAEKDLNDGNLISCSVNAYYSLYHLAVSVMWLLPERLPPSRYRTLSKSQADGLELPSKEISHDHAQNFFCAGQAQLKVAGLKELYSTARSLREAASYKPRVKWNGTDWVVGDYSVKPAQVSDVVTQLPRMFTKVLQEVRTQTDDISLGLLALDGARGLLKRQDLPFKGWYSEHVLIRAEALIKKLL